MGEWLYQKWLEEEVEDLSVALLHYGINGLLLEFEGWLERKGYLLKTIEK